MGNRIFCCISIFLLGTGPSEAEITQTPRNLVTRVKQDVMLKCQQDSDHKSMYWYQKKSQKGLKLLFYFRYQEMNINETVPQRFKTVSPRKGHFDLYIDSVEAEDSATYFCSSSQDTALQSPLEAVQKPPGPDIGRKEGGKSPHQ